jgi:uncharacterized membrane protein (UPF0127 family)
MLEKSKKNYLVILVFALIVAIGIVVAYFFSLSNVTSSIQYTNNQPSLSFISSDSTASTTIFLELATTTSEQEQGLSYRKSLANNSGMLFIFPDEEEQDMWMKDMHFSLDMIWFDKNFTVIDIKENATPESYPNIFSPRQKAMYVLEVNAGFVAKNKIKIGDVEKFSN